MSVKQILSESGLISQAGSIEIVSPQYSAAVLGQLSVTRTGSRTAYLDEELFMPDANGSQTLRAVIDSPENSPIVAVTNVSNTVTQDAHFSCVPSSGDRIQKNVIIQPKQTKLVRACSSNDDVVFSGEGAEGQFLLQPESPSGMSGQGVAGITITGDGPPGELAAFGFVEHDDQFGRYFSAMNFFDPQLMRSSDFVFTGVPVGKSRSLPKDNYIAQVAVTNFSSQSQSVRVSLAQTTEGSSTLQQAASFHIAPAVSTLVNLRDLVGDADWQNSFVISTTGKPGDVIAKMTFKTNGLLPNIELIGKDDLHTQNTGDHPWSLEGGKRSNLYLFNHSAQKKAVTIRIGSGPNVWLKMYEFQPYDNCSFSIKEMVQSGAVDMNGHSLLKSLTSGEISWWSPSTGSPQVSGRVVQMDATGTMARNFSCFNYIQLCEVSTIPQQQFDLYFGEGDAPIDANPNFCQYPANPNNSCANDGMYTQMNTALTWSWSSGNSNVAAVMSGASSQSSTWRGMAAGKTAASVSGHPTYSPGNTCIGQTPTNVSSVTITAADIDSNAVTVKLMTGDGSTGSLMLTLNGSSQNYRYSYNNGASVGSGTYVIALPRNSIPSDTYSTLVATWSLSTPGSGSFTLPSKWIVLGTIRHSQYDTVYESACSAAKTLTYLASKSCQWTTDNLSSQFVSQVELNGSGISVGHGPVKFDLGSCNANRPTGSNSTNTLYTVSAITGQCNVSWLQVIVGPLILAQMMREVNSTAVTIQHL